MGFEDDPLHNFVHHQLKRSIRLLVDAQCWSAAIVLVYAGIDTMAYLGLPKGQLNVSRSDFIAWAGRYIRFPSSEQLTGEDLYGARCAMLHQFGVTSSMSRKGECRVIGYTDHSVPETLCNRAESESLVLVSTKALVDAFLKGVDQYLVDLFSDPDRAQVAEARLQHVVVERRYPPNGGR
jgi:hypothetical protein